MEEKHTITVQVTAEQAEKIFKLISGRVSSQAQYNRRKRVEADLENKLGKDVIIIPGPGVGTA